MPEARGDVPDVVVFPPLILLAVLLAALVLQGLAPLGLLQAVPFLVRLGLAILLLGGGVALSVAAIRTFTRLGTAVRPSQPATALATTGPFAWTRNPIYLAGYPVMLALALAFALDWIVPGLALATLVLHRGVILREERYLEARFGQSYRDYRARVPRYLGPF
ncbi:MAG: methyltransferase family protein [Geminicoccaceae bacterium]|jgi:protein-S-isoprenylcysteine O-methyltransferase Ste14